MIIRRHAGNFDTSHLSREREDQVWCSDITFIPVGRGYLYLEALMDYVARTVLSWRVANTMHGDFCVDALNEAIGKYGPWETMNTDIDQQGRKTVQENWTRSLLNLVNRHPFWRPQKHLRLS